MRGLLDAQALGRQDQTQILITYDGNRHAQVPITMLQAQTDGTYRLPLRLSTLTTTAQHLGDAKDMVIPVIEEEVQLNKQTVVRGRVRITKQVHVEEETLAALLKQQRVQVERIPLERIVDEAPEVRYEGETLVIPVVEEVLVVEKRLLLKEEVRVSRHIEEIHHEEAVTLRREEIAVERLETATQD